MLGNQYEDLQIRSKKVRSHSALNYRLSLPRGHRSFDSNLRSGTINGGRSRDTRDVFSHKSRKALLDEFERILEALHLVSMIWVTDIENDIFAMFSDIDGNLIGYFYQGEYHLWEE